MSATAVPLATATPAAPAGSTGAVAAPAGGASGASGTGAVAPHAPEKEAAIETVELSRIADISNKIRQGLRSAIPAPPEQFLTVMVPGKVVNFNVCIKLILYSVSFVRR